MANAVALGHHLGSADVVTSHLLQETTLLATTNKLRLITTDYTGSGLTDTLWAGTETVDAGVTDNTVGHHTRTLYPLTKGILVTLFGTVTKKTGATDTNVTLNLWIKDATKEIDLGAFATFNFTANDEAQTFSLNIRIPAPQLLVRIKHGAGRTYNILCHYGMHH